MQCKQCRIVFEHKEQLDEHKSMHNNGKAFVCDVNDCGKVFNGKYRLIRHKKEVHLGVKKFKCMMKDFRYKCSVSSTMKHHIIFKHTNGRTHQCKTEGCNNETFTTKYYLRKHEKTVHINYKNINVE